MYPGSKTEPIPVVDVGAGTSVSVVVDMTTPVSVVETPVLVVKVEVVVEVGVETPASVVEMKVEVEISVPAGQR